MVKKTFVVLLFAVLASVARADEVYTYTGTPFNVFNGLRCSTCFVSGSFTVPDLLPQGDLLNQAVIDGITAFSFTDGMVTIDDASATSMHFTAGVDATGAIVTWVIDLFDGKGDRILTGFNGSGAESEDFTQHKKKYAFEQGAFGTWTMHDPPSANTLAVVATPEPEILWLLVLGTLSLVLALPYSRKRQRAGEYNFVHTERKA